MIHVKLLAVERIKLLSTRSPYWCLASILVAALLFALLMGLITVNGQQFASTGTSQAGMNLGMMVFMVLAALSATTEYRFGTIRTTFLAAPNRTAVLAAKTVVVMLLGAGIAAVSAFAAFFLTKILAADSSGMLLETGAQWRFVAGSAAIYPIAGVIAIAIGTLIRQSAGAISLLLVWGMLLEGLISIIPRFGTDVGPWLPFTAGSAFNTDIRAFAGIGAMGDGPRADALNSLVKNAPTPIEGLAVFGGTALLLWLIAAYVLNRRDA